MPTVPAYFHYQGYNSAPGFSGGGAAHDWIITATYYDDSAVIDGGIPAPTTLTFRRTLDGDNTGVLLIEPFLTTQFPTPHTASESAAYTGYDSAIGFYPITEGEYGMFIEGSISYPDSWRGARITISVHTLNGHGYYAEIFGPDITTLEVLYLDWAQRDPFYDLLWEAEQATHSLYDLLPAADPVTMPVRVAGRLFNFSRDAKDHEYEIRLEYGDELDIINETRTVGGLMNGVRDYFGSGPSDYVTHVSGDAVQMVQTGGTFAADAYPPRFQQVTLPIVTVTHVFHSVPGVPGVPGVPFRARITDGYGQKSLWYAFRPAAVANINLNANDDGALTIDGSNSFNLAGNITYYLWHVQEQQANEFGFIETEHYLYQTTTPVLEHTLPDDFDGLYAVILKVWTGTGAPPEDWDTAYEPLPPAVRQKEATLEVDVSLATLYDRRTGELRTLYSDSEGDLRCARNFKVEPLTLDTSQPLVAESRRPGALLRWGKSVFALSRECELYESVDCGQTWGAGMSFMDDNRLLGAAKSRDGSALYALSLSSDGDTVTRTILKRNGAAWEAETQAAVSGLPESVKRPSHLVYDGVTFIFTYSNDGNVESATSQDEMATWVVVA